MIGHYKLINEKWGDYIIKIHRKNAIVISMPIKFSKRYHCGTYTNKIQ